MAELTVSCVGPECGMASARGTAYTRVCNNAIRGVVKRRTLFNVKRDKDGIVRARLDAGASNFPQSRGKVGASSIGTPGLVSCGFWIEQVSPVTKVANLHESTDLQAEDPIRWQVRVSRAHRRNEGI